MNFDVIHTPNAPEPIGPYSQAVKLPNGLIMLSGQIGINPNTGSLVEGGVLSELKQIFTNIEEILSSQSISFKNVIKQTIFVLDINDFSTVNEYMKKKYQSPYPARSLVEVSKLPKDALIEIEVIAYDERK
jgi:2-iminobutanoate/2-iminopropanoate deaminase